MTILPALILIIFNYNLLYLKMKRDEIRQPLLDDNSRNYPEEVERTRFRRNRKEKKIVEKESLLDISR